jgi:hypothetical protein
MINTLSEQSILLRFTADRLISQSSHLETIIAVPYLYQYRSNPDLPVRIG